MLNSLNEVENSKEVRYEMRIFNAIIASLPPNIRVFQQNSVKFIIQKYS